MNNDELTKIIEAISVDFVLTGPEDKDTLCLILSRFRQMLPWSVEHTQPVLEEALIHIIKSMEQELEDANALSESVYDMVGQSICVMQNHARNTYSFDRAHFPFNIDVYPAPNASPVSEPPEADDHLPVEQTEIIEHPKPVHGPPIEHPTGIKHPESLPAHLDMNLFAEYLSLQTPFLEKMESLIMSLEQTRDQNALAELKRLLHTQKGEAGFLNLKEVETLCHAAEDLLEGNEPLEHTEFLFSALDWIRHAYAWYKGEAKSQPPPIDELLKLKSFVKAAKATFTADGIAMVTKGDHEKIKLEPQIGSKSATVVSQIKESILVDTERLDKIINMIGELVIAESMVIQSREIRQIQSQELNRHLAQMDKITRELQETGLSLRMVPIRSTFQKMSRLIRDISKKSGKSIECVMSGEETELDKTLVDKIGEPLLHIIRNAADHGIEHAADQRINSGKPKNGTIWIRAFHKSGNIQIEIEDDGRGLNKASIMKKAKELGLAFSESRLSDHDIHNLIFEPGFSTSEEVTDLSGRGVGMSVVKTTIESLRGHVDVQTVEGKGTTFIIKIPLTLAIIDGMIVRTGNDRFIIPTHSIVSSNKIEPDNITTVVNQGDMILVLDHLIPLYNLSVLLHIRERGECGTSPLMVVVESGNRRIALGVDELIGKQQIVIKSLGESMKNIPGISGAAIMADGKVGLIIDVDKIAAPSQPPLQESYSFFSSNKPTPTF